MKKLILLVVLLLLGYLGYKYWPSAWGLYKANAPSKEDITQLIRSSNETSAPGQNDTDLPLKIPDGYSISIFAKDLVNPRDLELDPKGTLVASITSQGKVVALVGGKEETIAGGLNKPHGIAFFGTNMFIAESDGVTVYDYDPTLLKSFNGKKILDLPSGGGHFTRSLLIRNEKLYVSIGSSCNVCKESDERRAAIWTANLDGSDFKPFATGLRNAVFMTLNPQTNEIWATEMGRDHLGDDAPPDEVNIITEGVYYGWPYCWGDANSDKDLNPDGSNFDCGDSQNPLYKLQAHSAPLGLAFLGQDLLVAFHGSWNRSIPTGYKIVRFRNGLQEDFVTGWLNDKGDVLGRPADILVKGNGDEIFVSDDKAGVIYLLEAI